MTTLMLQLQAAMGLGILLVILAIVLLVVVFPVLWIATTAWTIRKEKQNGRTLNRKTYTVAIIKGFIYSFLTILAITLVIVLLLYFFVDLSIS